jgi:protein O-GlcNAc transferase
MGLSRWFRRLSEAGALPHQPSTGGAPEAPGNDAIGEQFRDAVRQHAQSDLDGAETIYRAILAKDSDFVPALHLLGRIHAQRGKLGDAEALLSRALSLASDDVDILGDLADLRRIAGNANEAKRLLERALSIESGRATLHYALAALHLQEGQIDSAIRHLERTVALDQTHADALNDLGAACLEAGRYDEARQSLKRALENNPSSPVAYRNLANLCARMGDPKGSAEYYRRALDRSPRDDEVQMRLADALLLSGDPVAAMAEYRAVAERAPGNAPAWKRLAETAAKLDRRADAITWYRRALEADRHQPDVLNNLGILLSDGGCYDEAAAIFEQAVRLRPDFVAALHNLGGTCHLQNRHDEAVDAYKKALRADPLNLLTLSNFIAVTNYRRRDGSALIDELHASYLRSLAPERARAMIRHDNDRTPGRRLRVGYLSPDFRLHSVAFFIEPLIEGHDRERFEVYCYSDVAKPDFVTERLKALSDHWRDTSSDSDEALAERVRADGIDLLVDLDGHFAGNRLPVLAQKPAPLQLSYLGYPATTGLPEVDYRLSDGVADPPGDAEERYCEKLIRVPGPFLCYRPPGEAPPPARIDPNGGPVTFGSFNELPKLSPELLQCWCRILQAAPGSRLLLKATALVDPATCARVKSGFEGAGLPSDRIELLGRTASLEEHLALYERVDVALDTFPYNGTTTTCEALYMGVPVVSLAGDAHAGRVGASLLEALDLRELVASSEDEYVAKAVSLAGNGDQRRRYGGDLRDRMLASPLCDQPSFVRAVETEYLGCWSRWRDADRKNQRQSAPLLELPGLVDVELRDGGRMILPDNPGQLTAYVLLEQEDWFEDETVFLRDFLSPGMRVLDVGANFGVYTLLAARRVGAQGRVFSVEPSTTTARWLRANVVLNDFENVRILQLALSDRTGELGLSLKSGAECQRLVADASPFEPVERVKVSRLDEFALQSGIESIDFVKLDAEGAEKQIVDGGGRFFSTESPLIMFEIKSSKDVDLSLVRKFSALGYRPLQLIPGIGLLAPVDLSQPFDDYALNLFACKDEQWRKLIRRGLAAEEGGALPEVRATGEERIWGYFRSRPYSRARVDAWKSRIGSMDTETRRLWLRMLAYVVSSADAGSPPSQRLASLRAALEIIAGFGTAVEASARLHTLARISWAAGYRSRAVDALSKLLALGGEAERAFDWPFLPASPHFDAIDPDNRLAAWSQACALDQFECLRSFSSFYLREADLAFLQQLRGNPFQRAEMERRRLLVQLRQGVPMSGASQAVRVKSADNRNPDFWLRRLEPE